jgi:hypothetical protein
MKVTICGEEDDIHQGFVHELAPVWQAVSCQCKVIPKTESLDLENIIELGFETVDGVILNDKMKVCVCRVYSVGK